MLARHNLSQDEDYAKKKAKKGLQTMRHRHAIPALQLATLPPRYHDNWELWHRPRGLWVPSTSKGRARVKEGRSISGTDYTVLFIAKQNARGGGGGRQILQNPTKNLDAFSEHCWAAMLSWTCRPQHCCWPSSHTLSGCDILGITERSPTGEETRLICTGIGGM